MPQERHSNGLVTGFGAASRDSEQTPGATLAVSEKDAAIHAVQVALDRRDNGGDSR